MQIVPCTRLQRAKELCRFLRRRLPRLLAKPEMQKEGTLVRVEVHPAPLYANEADEVYNLVLVYAVGHPDALLYCADLRLVVGRRGDMFFMSE